MIGLDTNILLRAITQDNVTLSPLAIDFLKTLTPAYQGVINLVVLVELVWTLRTGYKYERLEILAIIASFLKSPSYAFNNREAVNRAVTRCENEPIHLADALICELNLLSGCFTTMTFDKGALISEAFTLLKHET